MIYLDYHGTAPLVPAARDAMRAAMDAAIANPSSVHAMGRGARALVERARAALAAATGALPRELVFTSGGTEALHLGVRGLGDAGGFASVLVDPGAHPALRRAADALAKSRGIPAVVLAAGRDGAVDPGALDTALAGSTRPALVALSLVQHETGVVADLEAVRRVTQAHGAALLLDAVQALGKIPLDLPASGAVAAAVSAHKIGGPTGVGALWLRANARATTLLAGGGQERGLRAGTENVVGIAGFGGAASALSARLDAYGRVASLRDRVEAVIAAIPGAVVNGANGRRVAGACHTSIRGVAGEELVAALDLQGFCVSSGPACSSGRAGPSESMLAMFPDEPWRASSALRITLGAETTADEVEAFVRAFPATVSRFQTR